VTDFLRPFFALNRRLSRAITPRNAHEANVFGAYRKVGSMLLSHPNVHRVADVGAGRHWHFPPHYKIWYNIHLIGLDIDSGAMADNDLLDERVQCDVVRSIPVEPASLDLIMAHSGIEHFIDNERFLFNAYAALRPGGFFFAQFPNRFAPFAIANRLLPARVSRKVIDSAMADTADELGYRAFYDRTHYSGFKRIFNTVGFRELYYLPGFFSSTYFEFFVPLYVLSYAFDSVRFAVGVKNLASYNLWVLQKPSDEPSSGCFRFYAWD
jgi:SAM-dependent methyltransferase